ncbi:hypothetical protein [Kordia jejudonensis]|uniref:hypothetical protein n=1 Tax=Kordia jejudonensis TaxID=1348245 RepID=UPI000629A0EA|nr:hypothetical protein [Kordia jejudonensis]
MDHISKKFYKSFYNRTNGFIPAKPFSQYMYPGDFFQIQNGEIIVLGNIFRNSIINVEDVVFDNGIQLNPASWNFNEGVSKTYSGRDNGHNDIEGSFEYSKQLLTFDGFGSFYFKAETPESVKFANWSDFQQELIIKMTQVMYSFREVYIVTETATAENWTLAIAGSDKAELEIAKTSENFGLVDIFGHTDSKTIQARDIEVHLREDKKKPNFFKGKKLIVQPQKLETFISQLITDRTQIAPWAATFYDYDFYHDTTFPPPVTQNAQASILDMLQANQLNPNTALQYFSWTNTNLDDVEKLFANYGN